MILSKITFPAFGLELDPSPVAFYIGEKGIYWYGIIIALGFVAGILYCLYRAKALGLTQDDVLDTVLCVAPVAIICARIYYCVFNWQLYADNPISCLYIWEGGLAIYGGVIGAVLMILVFCRIKKLPIGPILDVAGLGLPIGQCIGRWGNFINREAYGYITRSWLRMGLEGPSGKIIYYHPTFLYESLWNLVGFIGLHFYVKRRKYDGQLFLLYVAWYGLGRAIIEGLRTDSLYLFGTGIRVSQLIAILSTAAAVAILAYNATKKPDPQQMLVHVRAAAEEEEEA